MKQKITLLLLACLLVFAFSLKASDQKPELMRSNAKRIPGFVEEKGQFKAFDDLRFVWRHNNVLVYFRQKSLVFLTQEITHVDNEQSLEAKSHGDDNLAKKLSAVTRVTRFDLIFEGSNSAANVGGESPTQAMNDFYLGYCPDGILNVSSFNQIRYQNLYPGIDLVFSIQGDALKYEFQVHSGADPSLIDLRWDGVNGLTIGKDNQTYFNIGTFDFIDKAPVSTCNGINIPTTASLENNHIKFNVGEYNTNETLIIDPALVWASSLEYNGYGDWGELVTNSTGKFYIVDWEWNPGGADMTNYFNAAGSSTLYSSDVSNFDIVISQFSRTGNLLWVCRYGSTREDDIMGGVVLDDNDNLFVAGKTFSLGDLPLQVLAGAYNQAWNGTCSGTRGFLIKFNSSNIRQWATYIDNGANFEPYDMACGMNNDVYIVGKSGSTLTCTGITIPTGSGYLGNFTSNTAAHNFILRFNSSNALSWSTWLPGTTNSTGRCSDITVSKTNGDVFVAGDEIWGATYNFAAAIISAALTWQGQCDLFYMKFNASNNAVPAYGKYLGGAGWDKINVGASNGDLELDASGNLYMCGHTYSANFPTVNPGTCAYYDGVINDGTGIVGNEASTQDGYLIKINAAGTRTLATFYGGTGYTTMKKMKKDSHDNLWICSQQSTTGLPQVTHADYYNQAFAGANTNLMLSQLTNNDYQAWLSYFGYGGYMGYSGWDIHEPTTDSINLDVAGNWTSFSNTGGGYQYTTAASCSGAATFRQLLSSSAPFTISGAASICSGITTTFTATSGGGTWSSSNLGVATVNSSTGAVTGVSGGTTIITYSLTVTGCVFTASLNLTVVSASVAPTSISPSSASICSGASVTLTVSGGSLGAGASWQWYTGGCGSTSIGSGSTLTVTPGSTTTYYVLAAGTCNTTSCASTTITVNTNSSAPTGASAAPATVCPGAPTTLSVSGGSLGAGASWQWYTGGCGTTSIGSGSTLVVNPGSSTTYYVLASGTCNTTSCASTSVTVNSNSSAPTSASAAPATLCSGASTTLSVSGGSLGTGASWQWYTGGCGTTSVGSGSTLVVSPGSTTTYYVLASGTCNTTSCASTSVTVNSLSTVPTSASAAPATICSGASTTLSVSGGSLGSGASWQWYTGGCGTTSVGSGSTLVVTPGSNTTYYVLASGTCNTTTCVSTTVTVNTPSTAPTSASAAPATICSGSPTTLSVSGGTLGTGASWQWYTGGCGTTSVGSGATLVVNPSSSTTYYVLASGTCNTTSCTSTSVTVNSLSTAPSSASAAPATICSGASTTLSVSGGSLGSGANWQWFIGGCGTTPVGSGSTLVVTPGSSTTYYVLASGTCNTTTCVSTTVTVNTPSTAPTSASAAPATLCAGAPTTLSVSGGSLGSGAAWQWYTGGCGTTSVGSGATLVVNPATSTTYYVLASGTCNTTSCVSTSVTVNSLSTAPTSASAAPATICSGASTTLSVSGGSLGSGANWQWYITGCGTTPVGSGSTLVVTPGSTTTYYVLAAGTCNTTTCVSTTVTVNTPSTAPTSASGAPATICQGASTTLSVSGGTLGSGAAWQWYTGGCGTSSVGSGATLVVNPASTTTYYVLASGTCNTTTCVSATITVNTNSTAPTSISATANPICDGQSTTLSINGGSLGTGAGWNWYTGGCGTALAGSGSTLTVSPSSSNTYYVLASGTCNTTTCASLLVNVTNITASAGVNQTICTGATTTLTASGGGTYQWSELSQTTPSIVVTPGATTTYTVTVTVGSCSETATVVVNITSAANATITPSGPYCTGGSAVNLSAANPGGTWTGTGITNAANGTFDPSVAGVGTYQIIYTISGSCGDADTVNIQVNATVNADITAAGPFCSNDPPLNLTAATAGGIWSGSGITNTTLGTFNPSTVGVGTYNIIYTIGGLCGNADTISIVVNAAANATITPAGPFCIADAATNLTAVTSGGTWTGTGITNGTLGTFDPATAGVGTHQIIYTVSGVCGDADTVNIQVVLTANATINPAGPFCSNDPPLNLTAATSGGTWSGSGITNTTLGTFSPSAVGVGTYNIIYTISGACGDDDTLSITVNPAANATITPAGPYCIADAAINLVAATSGGTWTGTGITNASSGTFNPATAGVGTHQIIYTITGVCGDADTINIQVVSQVDASITPAGPFCTNNIPINLTAATSGGVWTGSGITNTSLGTFNPLTAGAGIHSVIYSISGACGNSDTVYITVNSAPMTTAIGMGESCIDADDGSVITNVTGGVSPYTYTWNVASSAGATLTNAVPGIYSVTITDANGCFSVDSALVSASATSCETIEPDIFVPNIFSPNGDLNNDVLYVYGKGIKELQLVIYDRWGEKVFETTDQFNGWDGTFRGKPMDPAVFAYYLKATLINDELVDKKGNITLVR
ncbi:MAG: gliding motility-associated C-terminal domain-containing protein [Bacteroidota bacterium]